MSFSHKDVMIFASGLAAGAALLHFFFNNNAKTVKMNRVMQRTTIKKDKVEQYKKYHAGVWPEVERGLLKYGVKLLTIWQPADGE